jgi:hypothetical protein
METTNKLLDLDRWSFVQWKMMEIPKSFIWTIIFSGGAFKYGGGSNFEVILGQTLNHFVQDSVILCNAIPL